MIQLKRLSPFQFHKGTIKTLLLPLILLLQMNFNSIKVRLKPIVCSSRVVMVVNFNSIKVRLKLTILNSQQRLYSVFQFHKGTIKTR